MKYLTSGAAILLALCTASCASDRPYDRYGHPLDNVSAKSSVRAPMDPHRRIIELNCRDSYTTDGGNLRCM